MFSGYDLNGDGVNSLNQFVNFGIASAAAAGSVGPIDWAKLAQQWIQMRDHAVATDMMHHAAQMPEAPPPPNISGLLEQTETTSNVPVYEEKGEADMDMDDEEEHKFPSHLSAAAKPHVNTQEWMAPPLITSAQWNAWPARVPAMLPQSTVGGMMRPQMASIPPTPPPISNANTTHIPSLLKMNLPNPHNPHNMKRITNDFNTTVSNLAVEGHATTTIDAAKRKILPAWIREGLEKMEREKLKQMEREQKRQPNDSPTAIEAEADTLSNDYDISTKESINSNTVKTKYAHTLANDDEHESSGNDEDAVPATTATASFKYGNIANSDDETEQDEAEDDNDDNAVNANTLLSKQVHMIKSYEERVGELMMIVRRTLTELLLDVTNSEIMSIAQETLKAQQAKASSAQVISKSALSSITGKLGLAVYDDSSSAESSDSENDNMLDKNSTANGNHDIDSEEELKKTIRMKRRAFARIADEIEETIAADTQADEERSKHQAQLEAKYQQEEKKRRTNNLPIASATCGKALNASGAEQAYSDGKTYDKEFGETTSDSKLQYSNGKQQKLRERTMRKERTTRFSDSQEPKHVSLAAAANYFSQFQQQQQNYQHMLTSSTKTAMSGAGAVKNMQNCNYDATKTSSSGLNNMLSAAEAALKKATKAAASSKAITKQSNETRDKEYKTKERSSHRRRRSRSRSSRLSSSSSKYKSRSSSSSSGKRIAKKSSSSKTKRKEKKRHRSSSSSRSSSYDSKRRRSGTRRHADSESSSSRYYKRRHDSRSKSRTRSRSRSRRHEHDNYEHKRRDERRRRRSHSNSSSRSRSTHSTKSRRKH